MAQFQVDTKYFGLTDEGLHIIKNLMKLYYEFRVLLRK